MLTIPHKKESLSNAFITALAAEARVLANFGEQHDYGVDGYFRPVRICRDNRHVATGITLDFQLKATTQWNFHQNGTHVKYSLSVRAYNDIAMREPHENGKILIVLCLPGDESTWLHGCEDFLTLRNCCYWHKIEGGVIAKSDDQKQLISIPRSNAIKASTIASLLQEEDQRRKGLLA